MENYMLDVITLGETMIRLSPPDHERVESATVLDFRVGGSEANVAVALSRLGLKTGWISKLTGNSLGRKIENELRRWNVNLDGLVWTKDFRVGSYYAEFGSDPRLTNIIYDRKFSAISNIELNDIDWTYLSSCKLFHTSGITVALSTKCQIVVERCLEFLKEKNITTSFDINFREKLWTLEEAKAKLNKILLNIDILLSSENDIDRIFKPKGELKVKCKEMLENFNLKIIVVTRGGNAPYCLTADGQEHIGRGYQPRIVDRIGAGDAFDAGFLYGFLLGDIEKAIKYGEAMSALKFSIPGDFLIATKEEIEEFIVRQETVAKPKSYVNR